MITQFPLLKCRPDAPAVCPIALQRFRRFSVTLHIDACGWSDRSPGLSFQVCILTDRLVSSSEEEAIAAITSSSQNVPCAFGTNALPRWRTFYYAEHQLTSLVVDSEVFHHKQTVSLPWSSPINRASDDEVIGYLVIVANAPCSLGAMVHMRLYLFICVREVKHICSVF